MSTSEETGKPWLHRRMENTTAKYKNSNLEHKNRNKTLVLNILSQYTVRMMYLSAIFDAVMHSGRVSGRLLTRVVLRESSPCLFISHKIELLTIIGHVKRTHNNYGKNHDNDLSSRSFPIPPARWIDEEHPLKTGWCDNRRIFFMYIIRPVIQWSTDDRYRMHVMF